MTFSTYTPVDTPVSHEQDRSMDVLSQGLLWVRHTPKNVEGPPTAFREGQVVTKRVFSSNASIVRHSAFFMIQLSHPYMTTGKNHSFDYPDFCRQSDVSTFSYTVQVFSSYILKISFSLSTFTFIKRLLSSSSLSAIRVVICFWMPQRVAWNDQKQSCLCS